MKKEKITKGKVCFCIVPKNNLDVISVKLKLNKDNIKDIWNLSIPSKIESSGKIKRKNNECVLDSIYTSYGIDLTKNIKLEPNCIKSRKKYLKERIQDLKYDIGKQNNILNKYKKELSILLNSNKIFNKYTLRKKKFNYLNLEKLLASFLLITKQVILKDKKFIYKFNKGLFINVRNFKSYNCKEPFIQRVFSNTLVFKKQILKSLKEKSLADILTSYDIKTSPVAINNMYQDVIYRRVTKVASYISEADAKKVLKALYTYYKQLTYKFTQEDLIYIQNKLETIIRASKIYSEGDKQKAVALIRLVFNGKFKRLLNLYLPETIQFLSNFFCTKEDLDKVKKQYESKIDGIISELESVKKKNEELIKLINHEV